ncbi:MAG: HoxN/HupN/NixA family nickel/cobalt transporter [Gammaproteobacteria bacterium]
MSTILILGFLLGMRHALEADHLAAIATLVLRSRGARHAIVQGAVWGLGHTLTLFLVSSIVLFLDAGIPENLARNLEAAVGAMLVVLGADVLRRLARERIHVHAHRHPDGTLHVHAHSHAHENRPHTLDHEHKHTRNFPARALCVGLMHGLAGSAALILVTLSTVVSPLVGLIYVGLFGLGSVGGMALLSLAISVPLRKSLSFTRLYNVLQITVALSSIVIGGALFYQNVLVVV